MMTGMGSGDEKMVGWTDLASSPFRRTAKCPHCVSVEFSLGDFKVSEEGGGAAGFKRRKNLRQSLDCQRREPGPTLTVRKTHAIVTFAAQRQPPSGEVQGRHRVVVVST